MLATPLPRTSSEGRIIGWAQLRGTPAGARRLGRARRTMTCCDRCAEVVRLLFVLDGDGDGVEFLAQHSWTTSGASEVVTVVYR